MTTSVRSAITFLGLLVSGLPFAHAGAQTLSPARWDLTLELRLDADREDFPAVRTFSVSRDGRIVVPLDQDWQVRFYDEKGKRLGTLGRRGSGPGDFVDLLRARYGWSGDQFWVYDPGVRRVTFANAQGALIRSVAIPTPLVADVPAVGDGRQFLTAFVPHGVYADGGMLGYVSRGAHDATNRIQEQSRVFARTNARGDSLWTIATIPPDGGSASVIRGGTQVSVAVPFYALPLRAVAFDGQRIAFGVTSVTPPGIRITVIRSTGDTAFSRLYPLPPRSVSGRERDSALAEISTFQYEASILAELTRLIGPRIPVNHPPVRRLLLGLDDTVWLLMNDDRTTENRWLVLDGSGAQTGTLAIPPGVAIQQASRSAVWATEAGYGGLRNIVRYRVQVAK